VFGFGIPSRNVRVTCCRLSQLIGTKSAEVIHMYLVFGMLVIDKDGVEVGTLGHVLVDPAQRQVTHVVVGLTRLAADALVPLSLVQGSADHRLLLHLTSSALENLPRYETQRTELPPFHRVVLNGIQETGDQRETLEEALQLSGRTLELGTETRVSTVDKAELRLVGLAAEERTYRLSEVVVRRLRERDLVVPALWVADVRPGWVLLGTTRDHLDRIGGPVAGQFVARRTGAPRRVIELPTSTDPAESVSTSRAQTSQRSPT
jgi:sporulation protein YlmC with PRC-barrel domain